MSHSVGSDVTPPSSHQETAGQEKIWEYFQNDSVQSFDTGLPRLEFLLKELRRRSKPGARVLNIGVGSAFLERRMVEGGWQVASLDPDQRAVERLANSGVDARVGFIEKMPFEASSFDFVIASEVLEHLNPEQRRVGIARIAKVLKPGGRFLGTVPFRENLQLNQVVCPCCGEVFHRWGHLASFTESDMSGQLQASLTVESIRKVSYPKFTGVSRVDMLKSAVKAILVNFDTNLGNPGLFFCAVRPER